MLKRPRQLAVLVMKVNKYDNHITFNTAFLYMEKVGLMAAIQSCKSLAHLLGQCFTKWMKGQRVACGKIHYIGFYQDQL